MHTQTVIPCDLGKWGPLILHTKPYITLTCNLSQPASLNRGLEEQALGYNMFTRDMRGKHNNIGASICNAQHPHLTGFHLKMAQYLPFLDSLISELGVENAGLTTPIAEKNRENVLLFPAFLVC